MLCHSSSVVLYWHPISYFDRVRITLWETLQLPEHKKTKGACVWILNSWMQYFIYFCHSHTACMTRTSNNKNTMHYFFVISFVFACFSSENQAETILENLHESQTPCTTLIEGKTVPPAITKGACAEGKTVHVTITRDCPNNTQVHTETKNQTNI